MHNFLITLLLLTATTSFAQSTYYGTVAKGKIEGASQLPAGGKNFSAYSIEKSVTYPDDQEQVIGVIGVKSLGSGLAM